MKMETQLSVKLADNLKTISLVFSLFIASVAIFCLAYTHSFPIPKSNCLSFLLVSISLLLQYKNKAALLDIKTFFSKGTALLLILFSIGLFFQWLLNIDFFTLEKLSPIIIFSIFLLGLALFFLDLIEPIITQTIVIFVFVMTIYVMVALTFPSDSTDQFSQISLPTILGILLCAIAVLCARPSEGLMQLLISESQGGTVARHLLTITLLLPLITGSIESYGIQFHWWSDTIGTALNMGVITITYFIVVYLIAYRLMKTDEERKAAEQHLKISLENLERSHRDLKQLTYIASHDLQEPLRLVFSYAQLLAQRYRDKLDAEGQEFIGYALEGATRMQNLLDDLRIYLQTSTDGKDVAIVNCNDVLHFTLDKLSNLIKEKNAEINYTPLPIVRANKQQLLLVFENLISNAMKFCSKTPVIHITAEEKSKEWLFSFQDNGIGIKPEYYEQIFIAFKRLYPRGMYEGTGIGLAICKKIIEHYGGKIWVTSSPEGSIFYFTLPKAGEFDEKITTL